MSAAATPFKMTLGDGSVVEAPTMDEAFSKLAKMKEDTSKWGKEQAERAKEMEAENERLRQQLEAAKQPPSQPKGDGKFDNQRYYELLNQDPISAQNYLDAYRFGIPDPSQVPGRFNEMQAKLERMEGEAVGASFLAQHSDDFPATPENIKLVTDRSKTLVENEGFRFGLATINYAYDQLVREGRIKPNEKQEAAEETPNPSLSGGGSSMSDSEAQKAEQMDTAQLEALLRSKGMIR